MKPSRSKRRRLMQSYIPLWPDLPATFESLNDDTLTTVLQFVGDKSYKSFGGLSKHCREIYLNAKGMTKETYLYGYAPLSVIIDKANMIIERATEDEREASKILEPVGKGVVFYNRRDVLEWSLKERNNGVFLKGVCYVAGGEGRFDLLNEIFNSVDNREDKEKIFADAADGATQSGKLDVLKWLDIKGLLRDTVDEDEECEKYTVKEWCATLAARHGHLHILKWLREEQGLELEGDLYHDAIEHGGHWHVLKWLREQACPWSEWALFYAAQWGNVEVLQYFHDEGCPRILYIRVNESGLKPDVVNWLRANGYGDSIFNV